MKATRSGFCRFCGEPIKKGKEIRPWTGYGWVHARCRAILFDRDVVNRGESFAGRKPSIWKRKQKRA